jgi:hypothetical protein
MNRSLFALVLAAGACCPGATVDSFTSGIQVARPSFWGQSFTTPAGGPWDSLTFNFYSGEFPSPISPIAQGTGYLLTEQYTGDPANLSSSTPGFLATSTGISSNEYVFASSVELLPGTKYFFYENASFNADNDAFVPSTSSYYSAGSSSPFASFGTAGDFSVNGDIAAASVPETRSGMLVLLGLCSLILSHRWARRLLTLGV